MLLPNLHRPLEQQNLLYRISARLLSRVYAFIIAVRNFLYNKKFLFPVKLPGTCISVGNITVGGTGKSPVIIEIAQRLLAIGARPVILTRGYRSSVRGRNAVILLAGK